jgi:hypothetical protein
MPDCEVTIVQDTPAYVLAIASEGSWQYLAGQALLLLTSSTS